MSATAAAAGAPRLLLSGESLLGLTRAPRDRALEVAARYHEPESLAVTLSKALGAGADAVLLSPTPQVRAALAELKAPPPVVGLLPSTPEFLRDAADLGFADAVRKRAKRAGPGTLARLAGLGLSNAAGLARGDFAPLMAMLIEVEAAALGAANLKGVVVAAAITDLALAGRHRGFFAKVGAFARRRFGGWAGFETHNLGHLLRALREWEVRPDFVIGPVNPRGLLMKPTPAETLAELRHATVPVLAMELRAAGTVTLAEGAAFARANGAHGLVPDFVDLEDLGTELRALRG